MDPKLFINYLILFSQILLCKMWGLYNFHLLKVYLNPKSLNLLFISVFFILKLLENCKIAKLILSNAI